VAAGPCANSIAKFQPWRTSALVRRLGLQRLIPPPELQSTSPPQLLEADMVEIFGEVPGMLNPPKISCDRLGRLVELATGGITKQ